MTTQVLTFLKTRQLYILLLVWLLVSFLLTFRMPLHYDEAYYWVLSNNLAFGYYDHPPLNMLLLRIIHTLFGSSEYTVRLPSILFHLTSIYLVYHYLKNLTQDSNVSFWWTVIYALIPLAFIYGGLGMNGDAGVFTFSILSIIFFKKALGGNGLKYWILFGISCGLGILTKFTFVTVLPGLFLYLILNKDRRVYLWRKEIYISILIAFLLFAPFLLWNANHEFATFWFNLVSRHEAFEIRWDRISPTIQLFLVFGPIPLALSLLYIYHVVRKRKLSDSETDPTVHIQLTLTLFFLYLGSGSLIRWHYLIVLCLPITANSLLFFYKRTQGSIHVTEHSQRKIGLFAAGSILFPAIAIIMLVTTVINAFNDPKLVFGENYVLEENVDPDYKRDTVTFFGFDQVGRHLDEVKESLISKGYNDLFIVAADYREASQLSFYTPSHPQPFLVGYKDLFGRNYIFFREKAESKLLGRNAIFVTQFPSSISNTKEYFEKVEPLDRFYVRDQQGKALRLFYFYLCFNYLGDDTGILEADREHTR